MKKTSVSSSMLISSGIGMIISVTIVILFTLISAICINNEYFSMDSIGYLAVIVQFLGVLLGSVMAGKMAKQKAALACGMTGAGALLLEICCAMLFFEGVASSVLYDLIASVAGEICAILICSKKKSRSGSRKKRNRYR